jgi:hypothetical protein
MPEASISCFQDSVRAASHKYVPLEQRSLQPLLVLHRVSKTPSCLGVGVPLAERCSSFHLGAKSALSLLLVCIDQVEDRIGTVKEETAHADWACHGDQEDDPNHGWYVLLDIRPVWPASQ